MEYKRNLTDKDALKIGRIANVNNKHSMKTKTLSKYEMIIKELNYKTIGGALLGLFSVRNSVSDIIEIDTKIQLLPRKWYQLYKKGWQTHKDFFGHRYFVRYKWDE